MKNNNIVIRVTDDEKKKLVKFSQIEGVSLSKYVLNHALNDLNAESVLNVYRNFLVHYQTFLPDNISKHVTDYVFILDSVLDNFDAIGEIIKKVNPSDL